MAQVTIIHPADVEFVPPRGRHPRRAYARIETPVSLREEPLDAYGPPAFCPDETGGRQVRAGSDGLWSPLPAGPNAASVGLDALRLFLESPEIPEGHGMRQAFAGTPVAAMARERDDQPGYGIGGPIRSGLPRPDRGEPIDLDACREVRRDGRGEAVRALRDFVAGDLRLIGGLPHIRRRPVAALGARTDMRGETKWFWGLAERGWEIGYAQPVATPLAFGAVAARNDRPSRGVVGMPPGAWHALGDAVPSDAAARLVANAAPYRLGLALSAVLSSCRAAGYDGEAIMAEGEDALARMREAAILARTGVNGADDLAEAIRGCLRAADAIWSLPRELDALADRTPGLVQLESEIRQHVLPALVGTIPGEDDEALVALAPGGRP